MHIRSAIKIMDSISFEDGCAKEAWQIIRERLLNNIYTDDLIIDLRKKYCTRKGHPVQLRKENLLYHAEVNGHKLLYSEFGMVCGWNKSFENEVFDDYRLVEAL